MHYMLDTNICIHLIKRRPPQIIDKLRSLAISDVTISTITLAELEYGVTKSSRPQQNSDALQLFLAPLQLLPFDDRAACHYGDIRTNLEAAGTGIGAMDMLIGAHARSLRLTLVTHNTREFSRITGLAVEDWLLL